MNEHVSLRLFDPEDLYGPRRQPPDGPGELSEENTLVEFFYRYAWPDVLAPKGDSPRTRKDYQHSLAHWRRITGDPPLARISKGTCSKFLRVLATLPGQTAGQPLSANTQHKHWQNIQRLLDCCGPQSRQNRHGAGLLSEVPYVEAPRKKRVLPRPAISLEEIHRWLSVLAQAARSMPKMSGLDPAAWWRALILLAYNTGMRPGTIFGIRWEMLEEHVLEVPVDVIKGDSSRVLWINDAALAALEEIRRPAGLVMGWPNWPSGESTLNKHRVRLQRSAGIRRLSLYALRRSFATQCAKISNLTMQLMLGHEGIGTRMAAEHYIDRIEVMAAALKELPQPGAAVQKRLF